MNHKTILYAFAIAAAVTLLEGTTTTHAAVTVFKTQSAREAKITMEQARDIAIKRAPGKIESSELEREHGQLVYSFDIRNDAGTITEVQVNAINGKIARVEHENKKQEAAEKRREKRGKRNARRQ